MRVIDASILSTAAEAHHALGSMRMRKRWRKIVRRRFSVPDTASHQQRREDVSRMSVAAQHGIVAQMGRQRFDQILIGRSVSPSHGVMGKFTPEGALRLRG